MTLHEIDVDALEVLIDYAYTAEVEISEANVQVLLLIKLRSVLHKYKFSSPMNDNYRGSVNYNLAPRPLTIMSEYVRGLHLVSTVLQNVK